MLNVTRMDGNMGDDKNAGRLMIEVKVMDKGVCCACTYTPTLTAYNCGHQMQMHTQQRSNLTESQSCSRAGGGRWIAAIHQYPVPQGQGGAA